MKNLALAIHKPLTSTAMMTQAIATFIRRCEARNLSSHTIDYYRYRFNAWQAFLLDNGLELAPAEVTPAVIRDFLASETKRVSALTSQHSFITLRCFFRFLLDDEMIAVNPMTKIQAVKQTRKIITTFTPDSLQIMLDGAGKDFTGLRLRLMLLLLADTGVRISELCGISLTDLALDTQTIRVFGKGAKERLVGFGKATNQVLQTYLARRGDIAGQQALLITVFGQALSRQQAFRLIVECGARAGVVGVHPHNFRRFFAVEFLKNSGDVFSLQRILGHTSLEMSRRYAEMSSCDVLAVQRRCSPVDALPPSKSVCGKRLR